MTILPESLPKKKSSTVNAKNERQPRLAGDQASSSSSAGPSNRVQNPSIRNKSKPRLPHDPTRLRSPVPSRPHPVSTSDGIAVTDGSSISGTSASSTTSTVSNRRPLTGYNSDDEHDPSRLAKRTSPPINELMESRFRDRLQAARGLIIKPMRGDGSCLFRAVADQIYGDEEMHGEIRRLCLDYMEKNRDHFSAFVTEDFESYLARKRSSHVHGNHPEIQAIAELFARPVEIFEYSVEPINIFHPSAEDPSGMAAATTSNTNLTNPPLRLSYHGTVHYNSVVDPNAPTIGVGLGLPGLKPGLADQQLLSRAMEESESQLIEEAMLCDKMKMTDWQRTEADIQEHVARQSYLDYVRGLDPQQATSSTACDAASSLTVDTANTAATSSEPQLGSPQPGTSRQRTPPPAASTSAGDGSLYVELLTRASWPDDTKSRPDESTPPHLRPSTSSAGLYEELLASQALASANGLADDEDAELARALLLSQQEFFSQLQGSSRSK